MHGEEKDGCSIFYLKKEVATKMGKGYDRKRLSRRLDSDVVMTQPRKKAARAVGEGLDINKREDTKRRASHCLNSAFVWGMVCTGILRHSPRSFNGARSAVPSECG